MTVGKQLHRPTRLAIFAGASAFFLAGPASAGAPAHPAPPTLQVQFADLGGRRDPAPIAVAAVATPTAALAPAPMPNEDIDDPALRTTASTRVSPALLSRSDVFEGDGYAWASNIDHGVDERTPPAPGINVSVPVK